MEKFKYNIGLLMVLAFLSISCQDDEGVFGDVIAPTNVAVSAEVIGVDASNPNGDGTGVVNFIATSNGAITYQYNFGDNTDVMVSSSGIVSHRFSLTGTNTYSVTVTAAGKGGISSTVSINLDVFSSFEDQEAKDFLSGGAGTSKTWYWAADKPGNIGLGPNDYMPGGEHTYSQWFTSNAWHADKLCMYDAEFVFTQSAEGDLTFEQLKEIAYTPGDFAGTISVDGEACHGTDVAPSLIGVKNVALSPSSSIATVDGEYRGTTMDFSDGGFMCWYVANSKAEIIEVTENTLKIRVEEGPRAWYCNFQTDNPND